ncbi:MAG: Crp/Fnr family transcriptional regulator [Nitrosospira sp.]
MQIISLSVERARALLATIKDLQPLPTHDLNAVAERCRWHQYAAGDEVVRYHENTTNTFFIIHGSIRVTYYSLSGQEVILCDLSGGEMFGELTAIDNQQRSANAVAKTDTLVAIMSAPDFLNLIHSNEQICTAILRRLTGQIRRLTERIYDYSTLAVRNRIHIELMRMAKIQITSNNTAVISPAPTHADIANIVSTHREAVTRELNELARSKLIMRQGQELHILDMARLTKMVEEARGGCA